MSRGVNKVILIGNLGQDPEVRYMPNGNAVVNFTLATSEQWTDQQGQKQERTEWHQLVSFGRLAEVIGEYLKKGSKGYFEGKLQTRKWKDQQGQDRYTTEIVVADMQMLDSKPGAPSYAAQSPAAQQYAPQPQPQASNQYADNSQYAPQPQYAPRPPANSRG